MTAIIAQLPHIKSQIVHVKSKYGAEFRRFSITPLDEEKTKHLLEQSNSTGNNLLQSTTPQLPSKHSGHHSGGSANRSSRSNNSRESGGSGKSSSDQKKLMRLKGITFSEFQLRIFFRIFLANFFFEKKIEKKILKKKSFSHPSPPSTNSKKKPPPSTTI